MAERKVLNKYFPPDFDPSKIPRRKIEKEAQQKVRLMTPFSMRCSTCGEYIGKGKKFNARKETVQGQEYLGLKIFRFYIRCPRCAAEITFKTDPQNTDYIAENGAVRNFEPWREEKIQGQEIQDALAEEEEMNPMKALENRTAESKREMDILDALDEIRMRNARNERMNTEKVIGKIAAEVEDEKRRESEFNEDEEALIKALFHTQDGETVKRLMEDEDEEEDEEDGINGNGNGNGNGTDNIKTIGAKNELPHIQLAKEMGINLKSSSSSSIAPPQKQPTSSLLPGIVVKKRKAPESSTTNVVVKKQAVNATSSSNNATKPAPKPTTTALGLLSVYGDDSGEDSD